MPNVIPNGRTPETSIEAAASPPVLEVVDVSVRFGGVRAVDGASLSIPPGEVRGLIGPNGSGKTTLFDVISGVRRPDSGRIRLHGKDVTSTSPTGRARAGLRRTFQRTQVFGRLTVAENLLFAMEWKGGGGGLLADLVHLPTRRRLEQERLDRVQEIIEVCQLGSVARTAAGALPVGVARRVEFARAIVDNPTLLLLDEPTSGLDHEEAARLGGLITDVAAQQACAVVLVEHDVQFLMGRCVKVSVLHMGRVIAEGPPQAIQDSEMVRHIYFGAGP